LFSTAALVAVLAGTVLYKHKSFNLNIPDFKSIF